MAVISGPAGTFTVSPKGRYGFVPVEVVNAEGRYSVFVRNTSGDSASLPFDVIDGSVPVLHLPPYVNGGSDRSTTSAAGATVTFTATATSSSRSTRRTTPTPHSPRASPASW